MSDFPPVELAGKEDAKKYKRGVTDPSHKTEMEGGYVITGRNFTRKPPRSFNTGFTMITLAQYQALEAFWDAKFGGVEHFTWTDPADSVERTVRFEEAFEVTYSGVGPERRFDVVIMLKEV